MKDLFKSKRTWAILLLAALQIFNVNVPTEVQQVIHAVSQ